MTVVNVLDVTRAVAPSTSHMGHVEACYCQEEEKKGAALLVVS